MFRNKRVAIVHYWLLKMRGGEKVLESLCRLLPDADIFTLFLDADNISPVIARHKITASFLNPLRRAYRQLLPLMPLALEHFDLRDYDLVLSSESGPAKGVLTSSTARHVCYCHTPMRYLWELYPAYLHEWTGSSFTRLLMAPVAGHLRMWDYASAARVDQFIANSENVKRRIWKTYRRQSGVIYPPVAVESFVWKPARDYFLIVGELTAYKRIEQAVRVFAHSGRSLRIVGEGPEYRHLKSLARPNIEFCGRVSDEDLRGLYARCRALLVPGEEDFGLTPVEALASGKPIVALGRGGVVESVPEECPRAGIFYQNPVDECLQDALERFEEIESGIRPWELQEYASRFSERRFLDEMRAELLSAGPDFAPVEASPRRV